MICPNCHHDNIEGSDECVNCGASLYGLDLPGAEQGATSPDYVHQPISTLRLRGIIKVGANDPVSLAVRLMQNEDMNCVLVMEGGDVTGILTGWDIVQKVAGPNEDLNAVTCGQVMTAEPFILREEDSIALALNAMAVGGFRHLPVARDGVPTGFIVASDLFRHLSPYLV